MKYVLSGTNLPELHAFESSLHSKLAAGTETIQFNLAKKTAREMKELLGTQIMFGQPRYWRIQKWESLKSPKQKQEIIALLEDTEDQVSFVVPQELTAAQKKWFGNKNWQMKEFKLPKVFFQLTESIKTKPLREVMELFQSALEQKSEWELHALIQRQFRMLLSVKVGAPFQGPPFAQRQLQSQAQRFTESQLTTALETLFQIELAEKTGKNILTWDQEIDRLLLKLYDIADRSS